MPKFEVIVNSLKFEAGDFKKGDVIDVSDARAALFDPKDIKALTVEAPVIVEAPKVEAKPLPKTTKKVEEPKPVAEVKPAASSAWSTSK